MLCVNIPDVREGVRFFTLEHMLPLGFKLKTVVMPMIAENNVLETSGLVASGEIDVIVFVARYH